MKYRPHNPEVLYTEEAITAVNQSDMGRFKQLAAQNPRKRVRLCTHDTPDNRLHEMLIVHGRGAYVHPHKHPGKTESTHIIEGRVDVALFDDDGRMNSVIRMGDYASGCIFYYRMASPTFHTLLIRSDVLVFHETTNGPFDRKDTVFAPWAPNDENADAVANYIAGLEDSIRPLK